MIFNTALDLIKEGTTVRRTKWEKNIYLIWDNKNKNIQILVHFYPMYWKPLQEDILATDWEINDTASGYLEQI